MKDLNKIATDATALRKKILGDLDTLIRMYGTFEKEVSAKFREEYAKNSSKIQGLEDFYMLSNVAKKNSISVKQAHNVLVRMRDIDGYDIVEETVEDKEIEELLKA